MVSLFAAPARRRSTWHLLWRFQRLMYRPTPDTSKQGDSMLNFCYSTGCMDKYNRISKCECMYMFICINRCVCVVWVSVSVGKKHATVLAT